jgi:AraC family transcriptional regulator
MRTRDNRRTHERSRAELPADLLAMVLDHIDCHLESKLSLGELAAMAHFSPFHFARLFKQSTGVAVHQWVIERRVLRSRQLLEEGELTIAEVASVVGFADQSHLARHFKLRFQVTPRQAATRYSLAEESSKILQDNGDGEC